MYTLNDSRRKGPYILATLLLFVLAFSLWSLGPRFTRKLTIPPAGEASATELTMFYSRRNTEYAYAAKPVAKDADLPAEAKAHSDLYLQHNMKDSGYIIYFKDGASFRVQPGLLTTTITTSDEGAFTNGKLHRGSYLDSKGRSLRSVYPNYAAALTAVIDNDRQVWTAHWLTGLIVTILLILGMWLLVRHDRFPWLSRYPNQPMVIMASAIAVILIALVIASRRMI